MKTPLRGIASAVGMVLASQAQSASGEIIVLGCPPQDRADAIASCDDLCRIARPARCDLDLEVNTRDAFNHLNHLARLEPMTIAAIQRH